MIYWHPAVNVNWRLMKIYWWMNRMQKRQRNIIFFNWNFFINTIIHCQTSFPFFEWKLGVSWAPLISLKMASYVHWKAHWKFLNMKTWFYALTIDICSSTSNSLIMIGNFWKHLTLMHIKASFFCSLYSYSWLF